MAGYAGAVMILNAAVQSLLMAGTNRLYRMPTQWLCVLLGGAFSGLYAGICLLPGLSCFRSPVWHLFVLILVGTLGFGLSKEGLQKTAVFILLNFALEGMTADKNNVAFGVVVVVLIILCAGSFFGKQHYDRYIPVELAYGERKMRVVALRDTGNMLKDPLTGQQVLVESPYVATRITGLSAKQLCEPLKVITNAPLPGLRLIPYRTVGQGCAFLLALRMQVKQGKKTGPCLVAFAPEMFGRDSTYQALTGGIG